MLLLLLLPALAGAACPVMPAPLAQLVSPDTRVELRADDARTVLRAFPARADAMLPTLLSVSPGTIVAVVVGQVNWCSEAGLVRMWTLRVAAIVVSDRGALGVAVDVTLRYRTGTAVLYVLPGDVVHRHGPATLTADTGPHVFAGSAIAQSHLMQACSHQPSASPTAAAGICGTLRSAPPRVADPAMLPACAALALTPCANFSSSAGFAMRHAWDTSTGMRIGLADHVIGPARFAISVTVDIYSEHVSPQLRPAFPEIYGPDLGCDAVSARVETHQCDPLVDNDVSLAVPPAPTQAGLNGGAMCLLPVSTACPAVHEPDTSTPLLSVIITILLATHVCGVMLAVCVRWRRLRQAPAAVPRDVQLTPGVKPAFSQTAPAAKQAARTGRRRKQANAFHIDILGQITGRHTAYSITPATL